jgi:hypothetical protein
MAAHEQGSELTKRGLMADQQNDAIYRPARGGEMVAERCAGGDKIIGLEFSSQRCSGLRSAYCRTDDNARFFWQTRQQPIGYVLGLSFPFVGEFACMVVDAIVTVFGFGVTPEDKVDD